MRHRRIWPLLGNAGKRRAGIARIGAGKREKIEDLWEDRSLVARKHWHEDSLGLRVNLTAELWHNILPGSCSASAHPI